MSGPARIRLEIDRLVLHGVDRADAAGVQRALARAIEARLAAADPAALAEWTGGDLKLTLPVTTPGDPAALGRAAGGAIGRAIVGRAG